MEKSLVLGALNLKKEHDYMWYSVTYSHQKAGRHRSTPRKRNRRWTDKVVKANFIIARRCRFYQDLEQTKLVGRLQIAGSGTYERHYHHESWQQKETYYVKDKDGKRHRKTKWVHRSSTIDQPVTNLTHFYHKMNAYGTNFNIQYDEKKAGGGFFDAAELVFICTSDGGLPLFKVVSDGVKAATIETFSQSDPVNAILAAFAVSVKMEPKEFLKVVKEYNRSNISLNSITGTYGGFGLNEVEYEAKFATPGEFNQVPPMGFAYGYSPEMAPEAIPLAVPVGTPFTALPVAQPLWEPIPTAAPLVMPSFQSTTTTTTTVVAMSYKDVKVDDGAIPTEAEEPTTLNDDDPLSDGDGDDDGEADEGEGEEEFEDEAAAEAAVAKKATPMMTPSIVAELQKLAELRSIGVLTEEEFEVAKNKMLNPTQQL